MYAWNVPTGSPFQISKYGTRVVGVEASYRVYGVNRTWLETYTVAV